MFVQIKSEIHLWANSYTSYS